jgi:hypothetical protein
MEYQPYHDKTFDYGNLAKYGHAKCGKGVTAPVFSVYKFGTQFLKNTKPVPLCDPKFIRETNQTYYGDSPYDTSGEFNKMMRRKNIT